MAISFRAQSLRRLAPIERTDVRLDLSDVGRLSRFPRPGALTGFSMTARAGTIGNEMVTVGFFGFCAFWLNPTLSGLCDFPVGDRSRVVSVRSSAMGADVRVYVHYE